MPHRAFRVFECLCLFVALPALLYFWMPVYILPLLWVFASLCVGLLLGDPGFDRSSLGRASAVKPALGRLLLRVVCGGLLLTLPILIWAPSLLFSLVVQRPWLWGLIMCLYPLLSVYPQEVIYRSFFFHRYAFLFPRQWMLISTNALLFGYMHIIFHNWIAVALTVFGGGLFATTYAHSRSTLLVALEHALFGCVIFTLGIGRYFYMGAVGGGFGR